MTEQKENFREAKQFRDRVLRRGFEGMETFIGTNEANDRLVYDCYEKDDQVYGVGSYLGSVIFDTDRDAAYQNEDAAKANLTRLEDEEPGLIARSNKS